MDELKKRLEKFIIKGATEDDCYGWKGSVCNRGYTRVSYKGISTGANRVMWMMHHGEIPRFHYVLNTCRNIACINPKHLCLSTSKRMPETEETKAKRRLFRARLVVDLPTKLVLGVKEQAAKRNITITKYLYGLIVRALALEASYEKKD